MNFHPDRLLCKRKRLASSEEYAEAEPEHLHENGVKHVGGRTSSRQRHHTQCEAGYGCFCPKSSCITIKLDL